MAEVCASVRVPVGTLYRQTSKGRLKCFRCCYGGEVFLKSLYSRLGVSIQNILNKI